MRYFIMFVLALALPSAGLSAAEEKAEKGTVPKEVSVDSNYDGKPDRFDFYDANGEIARVEIDADNNGVIEERIIYEGGKPVTREKDTNGDGKPDVWVKY